MTKLLLVDVKTEKETDVEFGTCDLCSYTADLTTRTYCFKEVETEKVHEIYGAMWSWGDLFEAPWVDNVYDFAAWVKERNFDNPEFNYPWLCDIIYDYLYGEEDED